MALLDDLLKLVVLVGARFNGFEKCSLWIVDESAGDMLRLASAQGIDKDRFENRTLRIGEGVAGRVAAERRFMALEDVLGDPLFKEKKMAKRRYVPTQPPQQASRNKNPQNIYQGFSFR